MGAFMRNFYLPKYQSAVSICGTTTQNGNRNRYIRGIFLSQIHFLHVPKNWGALLSGVSYFLGHLSLIEFAIRSIRRNKAEFIRTNKASLFCEVVEAVSHPIKGDTFLKSITKTQNNMKNPQNLTALLAGQCCTPQSLGGVYA